MQLTARPSKGAVTNPWNAPPATPTSPRHRGIDYGWGNGAGIYAAAAAKIAYAGPSGKSLGSSAGFVHSDYGNIIVQDLGEGYAAIYAHIRDGGILVASGTPAAGQQIALMGATGKADFMHLHFEVRLNGVAVDPGQFFTTTADGSVVVIPEPPRRRKRKMEALLWVDDPTRPNIKVERPTFLYGTEFPSGVKRTRQLSTWKRWLRQNYFPEETVAGGFVGTWDELRAQLHTTTGIPLDIPELADEDEWTPLGGLNGTGEYALISIGAGSGGLTAKQVQKIVDGSTSQLQAGLTATNQSIAGVATTVAGIASAVAGLVDGLLARIRAFWSSGK